MARQRRNTVAGPALLQAALEGLEIQKNRIEEQIAEVKRMLGKRPGRAPKSDVAGAATAETGKRQLSPAARKRIAAAQKRRWAEYRKKAGEA
jgi:hypothetical protein